MGAGGIDAGGGHLGDAGGAGGSRGGASFEELYNQSFARVYDFSLRMLRNREEAALAVQASYLAVYQELQAGEAYTSFPVQIFSAAHRDIAERLRRVRGPLPEGQDAFDVPDAVWAGDPSVSADAQELARTAWQVASVARPDELELLDLSVRQGLNDEEMAAVLRTRPETVQSRLSRLRQGLEESFSALVLVQRGRQSCVDLDFLVGEDAWSMSVRRRTLRHLQTCQICQRTRSGYPPAANVFAALAQVEAPRGWQEAMLARLEELVGGKMEPLAVVPPPSRPEPRRAPPPPPPPARVPAPAAASYGGGGGFGDWMGNTFASGGARGPLLAMLLGAMLVLVVVLAALCTAGAFDGGGGDKRDATTTPTAGTTTPTAGTKTPTPSMTPTSTPTLVPPAATSTPVPPTQPPPPTATPVPPPPPTRPPPPTSTSPPMVTPPP